MGKKLILLLLVLVLSLVGCSSDENGMEDGGNDFFYVGEGDKWFATFSVNKVNTSYFESLYIQYVTDRRNDEQDSNKDIGEIEYKLEKGDSILESSFPQPLKGIGNFHTATEVNEDFIEELPEEVTLTIYWKGDTEVIQMKQKE